MILNKANKNSPFKVPKDYFKNFDTDFFIEQELKNKALFELKFID